MIEVGDQAPSSRLYLNLSVLRWLALALGLLVVLHHKLLEWLVRQSALPNRELLIELTYGFILSLTAWLVLTWLRRSDGQTEKAECALKHTHVEPKQSNQPLKFLLQLHRRLSEAQDDCGLTLRLRDNGRGFDLHDIPPLEQHGLRLMRERAELRDADFQMASQEDKGTEIIVRLPLKELAEEVNDE